MTPHRLVWTRNRWHCPECGRVLRIELTPRFRLVPEVEGDATVVHYAGAIALLAEQAAPVVEVALTAEGQAPFIRAIRAIEREGLGI